METGITATSRSEPHLNGFVQYQPRMPVDFVGRLRRGIHKPPRVVAQRLIAELNAGKERFTAPRRAWNFGENALLRETRASTIDALWQFLSECPYPAITASLDISTYEKICAGDSVRILHRAEDALEHKVDFLGSGLINLGERIDWSKDYKTGFSWPQAYFRSIDYNNPDQPSDVKFPWEVSRMQWLIPAGQAFLLTDNERYARAVRDVLIQWIEANPYAYSVNWACTMEVALRMLSWTWFFHVFHKSPAWADHDFRVKFLSSLYLHADFTERNLELSDINGNHYTADAAGLVFAGLFFRTDRRPEQWQKLGWDILCKEITRQVPEDGVDFEASVPYHRLVLELFLLPALYRQACGLTVPDFYKERIIAMARFTASYSRPDGTTPLWGDADDARALPFGSQQINDHRYLMGIVGAAFDVKDLRGYFSGTRSEIFWLLGPEAASALTPDGSPSKSPASQAFRHGGFFIMRNEVDHVFIDCGPVGLAGRGGHAHNDCLSFEAVLDGVYLISDCGAYLYTASYEERNNFRSTAYHNTPQVDGEEINRFIRWDYLWALHNDARPDVRRWETCEELDIFCGAHSGYRRLECPVIPVRTIVLDHQHHALLIHDKFEGDGLHTITIPIHLAPGVVVENVSVGQIIIVGASQKKFKLSWIGGPEWEFRMDKGRVSPSYGLSVQVTRLSWQRKGPIGSPFAVCILPEETAITDPNEYASTLMEHYCR